MQREDKVNFRLRVDDPVDRDTELLIHATLALWAASPINKGGARRKNFSNEVRHADDLVWVNNCKGMLSDDYQIGLGDVVLIESSLS
jgi:hypothetical protein